MNLRHWLAACALLACTGCSHASGTIELVTDDEADTFTQDPVPTILQISEVTYASDGGVDSTPLVDATLPTTTIDLGNQNTLAQAILTATGIAADGGRIIFGASVPLDFGSLNGATVPIFVQRTGQFARLPGTLYASDGGTDTRTSPILAVFNADFLLVAGGDEPGNDAGSSDDAAGNDAGASDAQGGVPPLSETSQLYDFTQLAPFSAPPTLPQPVQSIAFNGTVSWLFDADAGTYLDFSDNSSLGAIPLPPSGGSFADIAGGATVIDPGTGNEYIVGGTRTSGNPSQYVLEIVPGDTSNSSYLYGNARWITLGTPRLGATAVWLPSQTELAVFGGNTAADGGDGAGVEVIVGGDSGTVNVLPFPPDFTTGAGAVVLDGGIVLLVGGVIPGLDAGSGGDAGASDGDAAQPSDAAMSSGSDATLEGTDASPATADGGAGAGDAGSSTPSDAALDSSATTGFGSPIATGLRIIDPSCQSPCTATPWGPSLPFVLVDAQAFTADGVNVLIVGNDVSGATHVFTANSSSITEIPTRVPHTRSRAVTSPTQTVLVVGGSPFIESFTPVPP